jgi:hypothetical protein
MKRLGLGVVAAVLLVVAAALSGNPAAPTSELRVQIQDRNPWTNLRLNNDPADFQFAIVSDRTGGHRPRVFSQAVEQLNLLQPEFVLSVGDLIEGGKENADKLAAEWREFQGYVNRLQMPFFYVPGNHDISNLFQEKLWKEKFGRPYYHFVYRNTLFLILNSEDPPREGGNLGQEQIKYAQRMLEENPHVRWTIVALHKPLWSYDNLDKNGWLAVEEALGDRPYTVFCGHVHKFQKFVRNGRNYYQLATTGGGSKLRGIRYGEFDHLVWVTVKKDGPVLANILLDGIYTEDMRRPITEEAGVPTGNRKPLHPVRGKVYFEGTPTPNAVVTFFLLTGDEKRPVRTADGVVEADGSFTLSTYAAEDGAPAGEYAVTVVWGRGADEESKPGPNLLPERYGKPGTSGLQARVKEGVNEVTLELKK